MKSIPAMAIRIETLYFTLLLITILTYLSVELSCFCLAQSTTTNTIKPGQVLNYSDKLLVSADGRFQLGFFNVTYSSNGYLGIRYTFEYPDKIFWVANRDTPFNGLNATLTFDTNGLLKITPGQTEKPIPLNSNLTAPNSTVTLENTGNLVVREVNSERVLWQSFDYPTDTLLPGMKLGTNLVTGTKWFLTSWLSEDNPGTGAFTLEYNHTTSQPLFVVRQRGNLFSREGTELMDWWGQSGMSYVSNKEEMYFSFSVGNVMRLSLRLEADGSVARSTVNSTVPTRMDNCNGGVTFPYECRERGTPECRSKRDVFERREGRVLYNESGLMSEYKDENSSIVLSDCYAKCMRNCSCAGFNTLNLDGTGCIFWGETAQFEFGDFGFGDKFFLLNSTFPFPSRHDKSNGSAKKWWISVLICALAFVV